MIITKYLHSCLLLEEQQKTILIDPGQYTYDTKVFPLNTLQNLDFILITHEHADHCYVPFIQELLQKFPKVQILTNESVVNTLRAVNVDASTKTPEFITTESVPHEDVVTAVPPENTQFTLFQKFTDPGDSYHIRITAPILALPIQAPWGSFSDALKLAETLSPQYVIPIHDWHWKDEVRKNLYQRAYDYLKLSEIEFKGIETGESVEINL